MRPKAPRCIQKQLDERLDLCTPQIDPTLGESGAPSRRVIPPPHTLWARVSVSVGCSLLHASKREAQALPPHLRRPSQFALCEVVCPMHSESIGADALRLDLCTMGLDGVRGGAVVGVRGHSEAFQSRAGELV